MDGAPETEGVDRVPGRPDVTAWRRAARRHQNMWRVQHGWPVGHQRRPAAQGGGVRPIGSRIEERFARQSGANFINAAAIAAAHTRLEQREKYETLDERRLYCDLLSSMPMCFNLLGSLWQDPDLAADIAQRWFPATCPPGAHVEVKFEWSPGRRDPRWLNDRTAFDAVLLISVGDELRLVGIETKYHEHAARPPRSQTTRSETESRANRYVEVSRDAAIFEGEVPERLLMESDMTQVWRDHTLALACGLADPRIGRVRYVLVAPRQNPSWKPVADRYCELLSETGRETFEYRTLDDLIELAADVLPHADVFQMRYLDVVVSEDDVPASTRLRSTKPPTTAQYLYVIGERDESGPVKIGISDNPRGRLSELASGNPRAMHVLYTELTDHARWVEFQLHECLKPWRVRESGEWYDVRPLIVNGQWADLISRTLAGRTPGANPPISMPSRPGHAFMHVEGRMYNLRARCSCGWLSHPGVMDRALTEARTHLEG